VSVPPLLVVPNVKVTPMVAVMPVAGAVERRVTVAAYVWPPTIPAVSTTEKIKVVGVVYPALPVVTPSQAGPG
jgi:hypothetical protein